MRIWAVVPIFNEEATVGDVVRAARRHAPVLVIDDGSTDAGAMLAAAAGAEVIRHRRRLGKGQALRTGAAAARQRGATHIVTLDGDGQHAAHDLPALLAAARQAPQALILGSRVGPDDRLSGVPPARLNAIRVAGFFVNWVSGLRLADTQSGFRIYPLGVLARLDAWRGGFVFETEVLVAATAGGFRVVEVPITVIPRAGRRSRFRPIADGVAIAEYLAGQTVARWAAECRAAVGELAALLSRDRLRVRHAAMLEAGAARADSLPAWGVAFTVAGFQRVGGRLTLWWRHPRRRRAAVAATACLAAPILLGLAVVQALAGRVLPDLVTPFVRLVYDQDRFSSEGATSQARPPGATAPFGFSTGGGAAPSESLAREVLAAPLRFSTGGGAAPSEPPPEDRWRERALER